MVNFGRAADQTDEEVREGTAFWKNKIQHFLDEGEPDAAEQARSAFEEYSEEARRRGLQ